MPRQPYPLERNFTYHTPPDDATKTVYEILRNAGKQLAECILTHCSESRERSLALTKIEEGVMWANAAVAREGRRITHD